MANFLLVIIVAAITIGLLLLKTNALYVFFALCSGDVLVEFANRNMAYVHGHLNSHLLPHVFTATGSVIELSILLVPAVLIAALAKHNNGPSKWPIQVLPSLSTSILALLFVIPLLSMSAQTTITQNKFWSLLEQYQIPVVGLCVLTSLLILIFSSYAHGSKSSHKS